MVKQEETNSRWARMCDTCRVAPCTLYCPADSAYLCTACDARLHPAASSHRRVWVCEACEAAPAAFLCKADAASLCAVCDADIHSANPLAHRHHRVPILPLGPPGPDLDPVGEDSEDEGDGEGDEAASWLLLNPGAASQLSVGEKSYGGDRVVPVQCGDAKDKEPHQFQNFLFGVECDSKSGYNFNSSFGHNVPVSSLEVGVVPESTGREPSSSHVRLPKGTTDLFSGPPIQMPTQLSPLDREARVMRYREKKKNRKFQKTIRYASRKAYAETRPRIKGRFAKRSDVEAEMEQMFPNSLIAETGYGVVPSF